jgi:hypothetical protein
VAEVLESGPERTGRRRRWPTVAGGLALAAVAAVLAARSGADPRPGPAPTPAPTTRVALPPPERAVIAVAVGRRAVYALVSRCDGAGVPSCGYRVHRREAATGRWGALPWQLPVRTATGGPPQLSVSPDEVVTLYTGSERDEVQSSADDGITVTTRRVTGGRPVDGIPPGGVLDVSYCLTCPDGLAVVDPRTGVVRSLAAQPPLGGLPTGVFDRQGDVIWAMSAGPGQARSAVSTDAGRSWRSVPIAPVPGSSPRLDLLAAADGSAWLVTGSYEGGPPQQFTGLRRIDGPTGQWRSVPRSGPRTVQSALAGAGGLLVVDSGGAVWRLPPAGRATRLSDPGLLRPGQLVRGPGGRLASVSPDDARNRTVLVSDDDGASWRAERVF